MGNMFCSSVVLVRICNTRGVYNFISKKANVPVNLLPFFNGRNVCNEWAKKCFSLKEQKSHGYLFKTGYNVSVGKTVVWSAYVLTTAAATFF